MDKDTSSISAEKDISEILAKEMVQEYIKNRYEDIKKLKANNVKKLIK